MNSDTRADLGVSDLVTCLDRFAKSRAPGRYAPTIESVLTAGGLVEQVTYSVLHSHRRRYVTQFFFCYHLKISFNFYRCPTKSDLKPTRKADLEVPYLELHLKKAPPLDGPYQSFSENDTPD